MTRSRQRKKAKQRALKQEQQNAPQDIGSSRGDGLSTPLLQDRKKTSDDVRLVGMAVKRRWNITSEGRDGLLSRLEEIAHKRCVTVITKKGELESVDGPADVNAIAAIKVIVAMEGQNQADERPEAKTEPHQVNVNVGVGVQVNQTTQPIQQAIESDPDFLEFIERKRLAASGLEGDSNAALVRDQDQFEVSGSPALTATLPGGDADDCRCGGRAAADGDDAPAAR